MDPYVFAREEFGAAPLRDKRLRDRLLKVVASLAPDPSRSLPEASGDWAATKGVYRFCANSAVRREDVVRAHFEATSERLRHEPEVLVVEDTTVLSFSHHPATRGLGKIGWESASNQLQGALLHSALAVTSETQRALGLLDQEVILRKDYHPAEETSGQRRRRPRESRKWLSVARRALQYIPDASRAIFVFDREGDVFSVIRELREERARFVIRAAQDRRVNVAGVGRAYLGTLLREAPVLGRRAVRVPARGGRPEREAELTVRAARYGIAAPGRASDREDLGGVWAREENPPPGTPPLEWVLLTSERVERAEAAFRVLEHYSARWKIEEWHKALKTGCRIEARELEAWDRLEVLVGIFSVIAWKLVSLRDYARDSGREAPKDLLSPTERDVLHRMDRSLGVNATARDYLRSIAKLGGFLGRRRDGDPGWITLWKGYRRLQERVSGFELANGQEKCG